jgi:hypothetical protein
MDQIVLCPKCGWTGVESKFFPMDRLPSPIQPQQLSLLAFDESAETAA